MARFAFVCTVAAAAWSPLAPEDGHLELLLSPLWLGIPLLLLCGIHEGLARLSKSPPVSRVSSVALLFPVGMSLLRLALACFVAVANRDDSTWHLWPLFTLLHLGFLATLSVTATLFTWVVIRFGGERGPSAPAHRRPTE